MTHCEFNLYEKKKKTNTDLLKQCLAHKTIPIY